MTQFEKVWKEYASKGTAPELQPLVKEVYDGLLSQPAELNQIKTSLENLMRFLSDPQGRTQNNCLTVENFFSDLSDEWRKDVLDLPSEYKGILDEIEVLTTAEGKAQPAAEGILKMVQSLK